MLSREEISESKLDEKFMREVVSQAEKRLADLLEAKKSTDGKSTALFAAYVAAASASFSIGALVARGGPIGDKGLWFFIAGLAFASGAAAFALALRPGKFGYMGSEPQMWMTPKWVDGEPGRVELMLGYLASFYQDRIDLTDRANQARYRIFIAGLYFGMAGAASFAVSLLLTLF
ncbi:hypothetical protein [Methylocystis parvus]|uniref:hypothetical protein n=1 Tax=Methylocystis parvus TaxID=134 RepID=UPI003C72CD5C